MRAHKRIALTAAGAIGYLLVAPTARGQELKHAPKLYPEVDANTWVMIEIWPEVGDITFHAYFMDGSSPARAPNLCLAAKRVFDRDAEAMAKAQNRTATSHRHCLTLSQAVAKGYISRQQ